MSRADELRTTAPRDWAKAQVVPFAAFIGLSMLLQFLAPVLEWKHPSAPWWRHYPEQWMYPVQALVCFGLLLKFWKYYEFRGSAKWTFVGIAFGAVGIGLWLLPTTLYDHLGLTGEAEGWRKWLGLAARREGFDPHVFAHPLAFWASLTLRFFRAAVVVALVEEIFWRAFLMRFVGNPDGNYWKQPFGRASWMSYLVVTACFVMVHAPVDRAGALVYGSLTYLLCVWSRSLSACVVMHATANFLMGCYIMAYGKYGLW